MKLLLGLIFLATPYITVYSDASAIRTNEIALRDNDSSDNEVEEALVNSRQNTQILGLMRANLNYRACLFSAVADADFEGATTRLDVFKGVCKAFKGNSYKKCEDELRNDLKPYLADQMEAIDLGLNVTQSVLDFGCKNDAQNIENFENSGGFQCFSAKSNAIIRCAQNVVGVSASGGNITTKLADVRQRVNSITDGCNKIGHLRKCIVREMRSCRSRIPANIINTLFLNVERTVKC